jgi:hypothetical protein
MNDPSGVCQGADYMNAGHGYPNLNNPDAY